jgi:chromosomal replication initiator protein
MNAQQAWQTALAELQQSMTPATFETWVKNTSAISQDGTSFTIAAPNTFAKEWLDNRFKSQIEKTLGHVLGGTPKLEVVVEGQAAPVAVATKKKERPPSALQTPLIDAPAPVLVEEPPAPPRRSPRRNPHSPEPAQSSRYPGGEMWREDDRWTFESFIVGPSNRFAFAAAQAVADAPATTYNPLFIHGGVGLGKTHLLHAIAQATAERGLRVLYVTSEQFTNDLIDAIQRRQTDEFRAAYRTIDVLLVDDIQFLAGKESTQEEFFHTFNHLHGSRRQLVISSDRPPRAIATLEQRLTSRFEWGLITDVQPPDLETRTAILRARAADLSPQVPDDVLGLLAGKVQRNVRELEGALTTVVAYARLNGLPLTVETATRAISDVTASRPRQVQPAEVLEAVSRHFAVETKLLRGKQRDREVVVPRQVAMYLMREETAASLLEIGRELGGRDHSTVLHGWEKIKTEVEADDALRRDVLTIREKLFAEAFG